MLNKTPNKQIYRMLSLLLNCLKVHVFVCLPLFNHRVCSIEILLLSKSETKTTTESFLICSYSSSSTIFLFVSNSQLIQFIINVIESMYYVIKLEIGTTKRIDRQHKRYVSFPILTHTKLKANPKQTKKKNPPTIPLRLKLCIQICSLSPSNHYHIPRSVEECLL